MQAYKNKPTLTQIQRLIPPPPPTREAGLSVFTESTLIGAHYASRRGTFEKSKPFRPTGSSGTKERSNNETALPQETLTHLQTAAMVYCVPSCLLWILRNFHYDRTGVGYADAGQMLFKERRPRHHLCEATAAWASAGISQQGPWCLHVFRMSLEPSPGICNWMTDFQNIHREYIFSSSLWTHLPKLLQSSQL